MRLYLLVNKIQPIGRITEQDQSVPFCCFFDNSNTNKKNNFSAIAARQKLVTIQLKVKELCYNYNNYIIYIYYKITKRCCFLLTYLSILLDWLANGYYIDHIYSREEKNELIPNCVFGACFAHKKYTKQKNTDHDMMCCASCQKKLGKNKINAFTHSHNTKKYKKNCPFFHSSFFFFSSSII